LLTRELEELRGVSALRGGVDARVLEKLQDVVDKACYQLGTRSLLLLYWCFTGALLVLYWCFAGTKVQTLEKLREVVKKGFFFFCKMPHHTREGGWMRVCRWNGCKMLLRRVAIS
jgi:hypothetical protein